MLDENRFIQVLIESVQRCADKDLAPVSIPPTGLIVMAATILIKSVVWVWCRTFTNSSVKALAQ